jgi:hypothetical protein
MNSLNASYTAVAIIDLIIAGLVLLISVGGAGFLILLVDLIEEKRGKHE